MTGNRNLAGITATLAAGLLLSLSIHQAQGQTSAFTYQGHLTASGSSANGNYDLTFQLFDASTNGSQVGVTITNANQAVSNGLFTVTLDFGGNFPGADRWLQAGVRSNGGGTFTALTPRQKVTAAPYAITAANVSGALPATQLSGVVSDAQLSPNIPRLNSNEVFTGAVVFNNGGNNFIGNGAGLTGVPGTVSWQSISGTSQQATANRGYVASSAQCVTITLPSSASVGDIVRVTGAGAGGWKIAQNAGQSIATANIGGIPGGVWAETSAPVAQYPNSVWAAVASSADGSVLFCAQRNANVPGPGGGGVWSSTNCGATWVKTAAPLSNWWAIASSGDGKYVISAIYPGGIWRSTNQGGAWAQASAPIGNWISLAASSDGRKLVAAAEYGGIYVSSDFGATWSQTSAPSSAWYAVASSADGSRLCGVVGTGGIWTSTNSGTIWTQTSAPSVHGGSYWQSVASSADGSHLVAVMYYGGVWTSANFGGTWTQVSSPSTNWVSVASSADGSRLVGATFLDGVFVSTNGGVSWTKTSAIGTSWESIASSADCGHVVAADYGGGVWTSVASTSPGKSGGLSGIQGTAIELQYTGNSQFLPVSHEGAINSW